MELIRRTAVDGKGLGFNLCVAPPHDHVVSNFEVMEFTEFYEDILEYTRGDGEDGVD